MKFIISQDSQQVFTCGDCQVYNISTVEMPADAKSKKSAALYYSVGVAGISFGKFKEKSRAMSILMEIAQFLGGKDIAYAVPGDAEQGEETEE